MVEVFKTNVPKAAIAKMLLRKLRQQFPGYKLNFDMHDCDKILRAESTAIDVAEIIRLLRDYGCACQQL